MATVDLELNADFKKATTDIAKFSKDSQQSLDSLKLGFNALAAAAGAVASAFAVKKITDAAATQEEAIQSLNAALALTGDYSREASVGFQEWASELQRNSTVGDEVSLSLVGLVKAMGATNEQTQKIIETATNMSAITGESLPASVEKLGKTLSGTAGRLSQTESGIRSLTAEQLKAGVGIDVLNTKYAGLARELKKTFAGSVKDVENSFGDLLEELGFLITQNPLVVESIGLTSAGFQGLGALVKENRQAFIDFVNNAIVGVVKGMGYFLDTIKPVIAALKVISSVIVDSLIVNLGFLAEKAVSAADFIIKAFKTAINLGFKPLNAAVETVASGLNAFGIISDEQLSDFQESLKSLNADSSTSGLEAIKADLQDFNDVARAAFDDTTSIEGLTAQFGETQSAIEKSAQETFKFADSLDELRKGSDKTEKSLQKLSDTNKELRAQQEIPFNEKTFGFGGFSATGAQIVQAGGAAASGVGAGAAGAKQLVTQGVATAANAFLPGAGAIAGPLTELLSGGPDAVRGQVEAFVEQLPIIIDAIIESLPVLIDVLVEKAPDIILALMNAIPKFISVFVQYWGKMITGFVSNFIGAASKAFMKYVEWLTSWYGKIFEFLKEAFMKYVNFLTSFYQKLGELVSKLFKGVFLGIPQKIGKMLLKVFTDILPEIGTKLIESLTDGLSSIGTFLLDTLVELPELLFAPIKKLFDGIKIPGLSGGGGGGFLGKVTKSLRFAEGGEVPPGFPNDTFPARLTSGENVIDRSTNEKLNAFLDGSASPTKVVLQVGERELAEVLLNINRQGYRTA